VLQAYNSAPNAFTVQLQNNATGQAQGHITAVCIPSSTGAGQQSGLTSALVESAPVTSSALLLDGEHTVMLTCGADQTAIDPGFQFDGAATVRSSEPASGGSAWTFIVDVPEQVDATFSIRCLNNDVSDSQGDVNPLIFTMQTVTTSVPPSTGSGAIQVSVTCPTGYEGIVGSYTLDPGLVMLGSDPQPITRVFSIYNPTSGPLNASLDLLCVSLNTGPEATQARTRTAPTTPRAPLSSPTARRAPSPAPAARAPQAARARVPAPAAARRQAVPPARPRRATCCSPTPPRCSLSR
jgi:hypothetical protein